MAHPRLSSTSITDAEIPRLATLTHLKYLGLANTRISDRAIQALKPTPIPDELIRHLQRLEGLEVLKTSGPEPQSRPLPNVR